MLQGICTICSLIWCDLVAVTGSLSYKDFSGNYYRLMKTYEEVFLS